MKTDKGQFDSVLSNMLNTPPKKEAEIKSPRKPKTDQSQDQRSDQQSGEAQLDKDGERSV